MWLNPLGSADEQVRAPSRSNVVVLAHVFGDSPPAATLLGRLSEEGGLRPSYAWKAFLKRFRWLKIQCPNQNRLDWTGDSYN